MIPLNESSNLEFSLSIQNTTNKLDRATMYIEGGSFDIALPIVLEGDKAKVSVPALENILKPGNYGMRLEMVLGGVLYTPFKDTLDFNAPPSIKVESAKTNDAPSFMVTPKTTIVPVVVEKEDKDVSDQGEPKADPDEVPANEKATTYKYHEEFAKLLQDAFVATKK